MRSSLYTLRAFQAGRFAATLLPHVAIKAVAQAVGNATYIRNPRLRSVLRENLAPVSGLSGLALDRLCARNVAHFSGMLADYFYSASRTPKQALSLIREWRGYEHLEKARSLGRGVIVVTAHLGNWELGGILLAQRGLPMTVITLDEPSTALTAWRDSYRQRAGMKTIAVGPGRDFAFVEMIQTLKRNECLAMLVDRPYGNTGLPVQFCGRQTQFSSGPALLWQHTGAAIVPAFLARDSRGHYVSFAEPLVNMQKGENPREALAANTQAVANAFESVVRRYPEQWFHYVPIWN